MLLELFAMAGGRHPRVQRLQLPDAARGAGRGTALLIGLLSGPKVIRKLTELKIGQAVRSDGPQSHLSKPARRRWVAR